MRHSVPAPGGIEEQYSSPPPSASPAVSFEDIAPDAMALWPVIAIVGVCTAIALTLIILAAVAFARKAQ